ncbi:MAG: hypothetical protein RMK18_02520 [Armatimonadota bacterium]|nr:hypothetical protein [Armatimonadota bacterium]MCX7777593.1 hypothetical protein [Armatimonadota bacterium]MDW8024729.1 hypothetical protein [Armatimonadota bacterium]
MEKLREAVERRQGTVRSLLRIYARRKFSVDWNDIKAQKLGW